MDDRVIEAAAMAVLTEFGEVPYYRDMAEAAIRAALRELAPDIRTAVDLLIRRVRLEKAAQAGSDERWKAEMGRLVTEASRDLFALLGIAEDRA